MDIINYLTLPLPRFLKATGISRERAYRLIASGELRSFLLGHRRFIDIGSYRALIERQRAAEIQWQAPPPRRRRALGSEPPAGA